MDQQGDADEAESGASIGPEVLKSYLSFGLRVLRKHKFIAAGVFAVGVGLTLAANAFLPRTFVCKTVLMAQASPILDRNDAPNPLASADSLILRHENLKALIDDIGLLQTFEPRRPAIIRLKDRIITALLGPPSDKAKIGSLVGTMESKIDITTEKNELSITVSWTDGQTAAELADAARESFLKARHAAEISAFEDKMAIFDEHASKLREEIATLADQMNAANQTGSNQLSAAAPVPNAAAPRQAVRVAATHSPNALVTEQLSSLREKLAADKPKLAEQENEWHRRLRDEQAKLADLKLRLTPSHPEVVTEEERVAMLSQVPLDVTTLRAEVSTLETDIRAAELISAHAAGGTASAFAPNAEALTPQIIQALEKDDADPALRAQLSGAIMKYADLRNDILSGRIDLDTAQAAFNHRYQLLLPADVPSKATKPKPALIIGGGLFVSLLLALLLPILMELRKGIIVDRWQVHSLQLPVLAELKLPPNSG